MIQNILTFCVKNDLTYVDGSIPSGKLVANDINRNSIYLITPYDEAIVKANFQTNLQSDTPTSALGILVNGEIEVSELVDINASYYNLVKDWNIYEFKVPSTTLSFISRNRTGKIGINFSIEQRLVPMIKVSYGTYKGEITELAQTPTEDGYYIIKALGYGYEDSVELKSFDLNDILVYNATDDVATKISAYSNRGSTPTAMYSVDPSLLNDNFETIDVGLTAQIVQQVNDNTSDILLLNQGVLNDGIAITDLQNRMSVAESDIDIAENNIINLQGRMATAESDIDNIENGTTIVEKANKDSLGNVIKNHYIASVIPIYDDNTNNFYLNPYNGDDTLMTTRVEGITLPKATTSKDGLMAKEDKVKVDNIASDISSAITNHDNSATAHLLLRTLINNLQQEIDRLNAKGRSWGEIDKTFSELWAIAEPTRSDYINTFLATNFSGYTPSNGDLVYTIVSDTEEIHELEYNSSLSQWVDNGAYIVGKASNTQMGIVQGDLTYVSILNGLIQVLKSDYATNVGSSGASYDYADLLALFTEVANDIYKKNETYSATQIEQRITDLLGLANLQDTAIEKSGGVYDFNNGDSILASSLSQYNWVITRFYNVDGGVQNVRYNLFKPSEAVSGNRTIVQIDRTPVRYAEIKRDNGNILFRVVDESDTFDNTYVCTMKMWGIKLDGITASEVDYDNSTSGLVADKVQSAIDEVVVELNTLENKVDLANSKQDTRINEIEELARKSASGETSDNVLGTDVIPLSKDTANAPMSVEVDGGVLEAPNLVVNGDFSNGTTGWVSSVSTSVVVNNNLINTSNGSSNIPYITYLGSLVVNDDYYITIKNRVLTTDCLSLLYKLDNNIGYKSISNPIQNQWYVNSDIIKATTTTMTARFHHTYLDNATSNGKQMEVDYVYVFNVSTMKLKGVKDDNGTPFTLLTNTQIKTQLDLWISKGIIPNDNLLSVNMNKRVRSEVGGDTINEMYQLVANGDFNNGTTEWTAYRSTISANNNILTAVGNVSSTIFSFFQTISSITLGETYYFYTELSTPSVVSKIGLAADTYSFETNKVSPVINTWYKLSGIRTITTTGKSIELFLNNSETNTLTLKAKNIRVFNVSQMKKDGWFVGMDNTQIKAFLDKVLQQGKANSDLYLQANVKGYSLPNGVKDTIEYRNGKYYFVKRVGEYTLQASYISGMFTDGSTYNVANTGNILPLAVSQVAELTDRNTLIKGMQEKTTLAPFVAGTYYTSPQSQFRFLVPIGLTLEQARTQLAGTKIYYQLATPIETEIEAWGNLQGYESGIVYVDDIKIDASIYASGITTTSKIKALDEIVKINNGVETQLDTSLAVIAVDKLSFTHPNLVDGDYVWFAYEEDGNYYKATTDITYYIDKLVRTSPDGSVWKLDWSVSNLGVITWTPTKI